MDIVGFNVRQQAADTNRVFAKLDVRDRAQAVRYAYEHGLARRPPV